MAASDFVSLGYGDVDEDDVTENDHEDVLSNTTGVKT